MFVAKIKKSPYIGLLNSHNNNLYIQYTVYTKGKFY